jgi:hypothetical protein
MGAFLTGSNSNLGYKHQELHYDDEQTEQGDPPPIASASLKCSSGQRWSASGAEGDGRDGDGR